MRVSKISELYIQLVSLHQNLYSLDLGLDTIFTAGFKGPGGKMLLISVIWSLGARFTWGKYKATSLQGRVVNLRAVLRC